MCLKVLAGGIESVVKTVTKEEVVRACGKKKDNLGGGGPETKILERGEARKLVWDRVPY